MAICAVGDYNARPFVSPRNGACMTNGPLNDAELGKSPSEERARQSRERARKSDVNEKILNIKAILDESGELIDDNEKQAMRKKLFEVRMQCIKDGEGGSGVIKFYFALS